MASTKSATAVWSSQTLTAGAGDTTSSTVDLQDGYGALAMIRLTNGATGPTIAAQVQLQISEDDSSYYDYGSPFVGTTDNNDVIEWTVPIDIGAPYLQMVAGSNTAQNVTVDAKVVEITKV